MDDDELLAAVMAAPDDDAPRLAFAAWLTRKLGKKDARAGLIRVQCELARLGDGDPRRAKLAKEEAALLARCERAWGALGFPWGYKAQFRRGFVDELELHGEHHLPGLEHGVAGHP